jgi:small subunit ribosomal protein S5
MIIGDKKGSIGVGTGKSIDTSNAIQKALKNAKKNLVKLKLTKEHSLPYNVEAKYATSRLTMMPNKGKGIVAGSAARDILKLGGMKNVTAKFHSGSKNKLNNARATVVALSGDLGAGKTTLTQFVAKHFSVDDVVQSPTFVIMKLYPIEQHSTLLKSKANSV